VVLVLVLVLELVLLDRRPLFARSQRVVRACKRGESWAAP
jgi:hypothetical protein